MTAPTAFRHLAVLLAVSGALASHAQSEEDALRYSYILPGGTARSWALGGAFGAVGADPASASAPFVATLVDVSGILIYFGIANLILSGVLPM